ncbi:cohesin domain-containing protein [Paenibacillus thalictri]|uniref:Fibronectin type-III domain-containing protein n=1 Tax=Paenibacillus thalictri TaxID=2527873 RepID=A0A4Q9DSZ7_9BACL|nr:cohesin domain-containing protein [Paenibacillus thalictri]TBL79366.1 hypothetical protein EYB31_10640 [Paenibacillus thalictri]
MKSSPLFIVIVLLCSLVFPQAMFAAEAAEPLLQLSAPSSPVASSVYGSTYANITWTPVLGSMGYNVKRSILSGGPYSVIAPSVTGVTYTDTSLLTGTTYYYVVSALNGSGESLNSNEVAVYIPPNQPVLDIRIAEEKIAIGTEFTANVVLANVSGIYAEDVTVGYDKSLFDFIGFEEVPGYTIYNASLSQNGTIRFIAASQGQAYGITGEATLLKLKLRAKAAGTGKVDALKCRIADTAKEFDLLGRSCNEDTVIVQNALDVNRSGEYTLLDLAIDAYYYGQFSWNTPAIYNTNQAGNDYIGSEDLLFIVQEMLKNANYAPNS